MTTKSKHTSYLTPWMTDYSYNLDRIWSTMPLSERKKNTPGGYYVNVSLLESAHIGHGGDAGGINKYGFNPLGYDSLNARAAYSKAYGKFIDSLHQSSQWAVNAAEHEQASSMIAGRAKQLISFVGAVKKGNVIGAAKALGLTPSSIPRGVRGKSKSLANNFLEWHFGWEPLIQDIGAGVGALSHPVVRHTVKSRATFTDDSTYRNDIDGYRSLRDHLNIQGHYRLQAIVSVGNPWAATANDLGFVNPLSVAWELVPFSFVVDWFSNVGQVLGAMTDFVGYNIENSFVTQYFTWRRSVQNFFYRPEDAPYSYTGSASGYHMSRGGGITSPSLTVKPFHGFSPTRAATAISLLVQSLK